MKEGMKDREGLKSGETNRGERKGKTLRWGVLGTAAIARERIMPAIRESGNGVLAAIASRSKAKSKAAAAKFGIAKAYGSYEALLRDPDIDAVYIPLPNHLHAEWSIAAARAGKHVLCEKPAALHAAEAAAMVEAARKANVHLAEALMFRHHPLLAELKRRLQSGAIGELRLIRASFTCSGGLSANDIRFHRRFGGGALYDLAEYPLSAARWLTGAEPEAITVHAVRSADYGQVDMMASGLAEFPGGVSLLFDCGLWAEERRSLELVGSRGRIEMPVVFSGINQSGYTLYQDGRQIQTRKRPQSSYRLEIEDFGATVLEGKPPLLPPEDIVVNSRLLEACQISARKQKRVELSALRYSDNEFPIGTTRGKSQGRPRRT